MDESITAAMGLTIGLDLGDRFTEGRVLDASGEVVESFRVRTTEPTLASRLSSFAPSRVVLEVGTHSPWVSRVVTRLGHEGIVANPRRVRLIAENDSKSDGVDAELLARLGRVDPALLKPIVHRGADAQRDRMLIQSRDGFVRARTQLVNQARGLAKALGTRMPTSSTDAFPKRVRAVMPRALSRDRVLAPGAGRGSDHGAVLRADDRRPEPLCEESLGGRVPRTATEATRLGRATATATDHEGWRRVAASPAGERGALRPRTLRARHGLAARGAADGGARWQRVEEAGDRSRGAATRGAAAPVVGDARGVRRAARVEQGGSRVGRRISESRRDRSEATKTESG